MIGPKMISEDDSTMDIPNLLENKAQQLKSSHFRRTAQLRKSVESVMSSPKPNEAQQHVSQLQDLATRVAQEKYERVGMLPGRCQ